MCRKRLSQLEFEFLLRSSGTEGFCIGSSGAVAGNRGCEVEACEPPSKRAVGLAVSSLLLVVVCSADLVSDLGNEGCKLSRRSCMRARSFDICTVHADLAQTRGTHLLTPQTFQYLERSIWSGAHPRGLRGGISDIACGRLQNVCGHGKGIGYCCRRYFSNNE